jgi:exodeoxyribonuclease V gamma subunit
MMLQVLGALAQHRPVDLYLLVPTPGYIADLKSRRERDREPDPRDLAPAEELVGELGKLGREFFETLLDLDQAGAAFEEAGFRDPGTDTVLHHLQSALFASGGEAVDAVSFDESDRSLLLHSCHSPLREMEVLRDEVLAALADGTADSVADVLLLVPDIRKYAPFARSVFGAAIENVDGSLRLPLRVADRSGASDQPFARLILLWLELAAARLTLADVFPVLHETVVRHRFGLVEEDLDSMRDRLREVGVIWGVDPQVRARRTGTPEFDGVSWREGLDRLLLGCFTGPIDELVDGILPAADAATRRSVPDCRLGGAHTNWPALPDRRRH